MDQNTKTWAMILHLSVFAAYIVPIAGVIAPIVIWQVKKDEMPELDAHGKTIVNFIISMVIYSIVAGLLVFVLIGIPLLIALSIVGIVYPIIGGLKANNGELWGYPGIIRLFR